MSPNGKQCIRELKTISKRLVGQKGDLAISPSPLGVWPHGEAEFSEGPDPVFLGSDPEATIRRHILSFSH
jgi:hypothetical protein